MKSFEKIFFFEILKFFLNFEIYWKFWNFWKYLKIITFVTDRRTDGQTDRQLLLYINRHQYHNHHFHGCHRHQDHWHYHCQILLWSPWNWVINKRKVGRCLNWQIGCNKIERRRKKVYEQLISKMIPSFTGSNCSVLLWSSGGYVGNYWTK